MKRAFALSVATLSVVTLSGLATSCSSDAPSSSSSSGSPVTAGAAFPADRCAANKAAGKITYLSGFDYSASASIVEVMVARKKGYFAALCLDVDVKSSFSTANYPLVAANTAQFASAGSYSEMLDYSVANDAKLTAITIDGKTGIDALIVKPGEGTTAADMKGKTIGVKGAISRSVKAMLAKAGLVEGKDYKTLPIDGFDPKVHIALPVIAAFPGYKSNEPLQLTAAGVDYTLINPTDAGVPGSFGVIFTSAGFQKAHPSAVEDFTRASLKGLADAIADPKAAVDVAIENVTAGGNPNFLSPEGEAARWSVESKLVAGAATATVPAGVPDLKLLADEVAAYDAAGIFTKPKPSMDGTVNATLAASLYADDGSVIWPKV